VKRETRTGRLCRWQTGDPRRSHRADIARGSKGRGIRDGRAVRTHGHTTSMYAWEM
jgi:hypothetical protein